MKTPAEEKPKARRSRTQDQGSTRSGKERVEAAMIAAKAAKARIWPTVAMMRTPIKQPAAKPTEWQATTMPMRVVEKSSMVIRHATSVPKNPVPGNRQPKNGKAWWKEKVGKERKK